MTNELITAVAFGQGVFLVTVACIILYQYAWYVSGARLWHVMLLAVSYIMFTCDRIWNIYDGKFTFTTEPGMIIRSLIAAGLGDIGLVLMLRYQSQRGTLRQVTPVEKVAADMVLDTARVAADVLLTKEKEK